MLKIELQNACNIPWYREGKWVFERFSKFPFLFTLVNYMWTQFTYCI